MSAPTGRLTRAVVHVQAEFRATSDSGAFDATVLRYNVRDDYNTEFAPGAFDASLATRMPRIAWGHDWRQMVGQWTKVLKNDKSLLRMSGQLDLAMIPITDDDGKVINRTPAVPLAWQAWAQLQSGTASEYSIGFIPEEWRDVQEDDDYYRVYTRGRLDEVSIVLAGAVPGTGDTVTRSAGIRLMVREPVVGKEKVAALIVRLQLGEIDLADALTELKNMPAEGDTTEPPEAPPVAPEATNEPPAPEVTPPEGQASVGGEEGEQGTAQGDGGTGNADANGLEPPEPSDGLDDDDFDAEVAAALELVDAL